MTNPYQNQNAIKALANLEQDYNNWVEAMRATQSSLIWRTRGDTEYLYQRSAGAQGSIEKSLGPRNDDTEAMMVNFQNAKSRATHTANSLRMVSATCRAHGVPQIGTVFGKILRQLDIDGQNGDGGVMVVGTNALYAYEQEAMVRLPETMMETADMDLAWRRTAPWDKMERPILDSLKRADSTWTINSERNFQALDKYGNELEVLAAKTVCPTLGTKGFRPVDIPEQEWLLKGTPVVQILPTVDRNAARVMAPDPRWFALHKLFMSTSDRRNPKKQEKDRIQGVEVLNMVASDMPHYPLDESFEDTLPDVLKQLLNTWKQGGYVVSPDPKPGMTKQK